MNWDLLFFGFLQGLTEFLPISSSGHLFLIEQLLKTEDLSLSFVLLLHLATLLSVLAVFFKDIKNFVFKIFEEQNKQLCLKILIALFPLLCVGLFLKSFVQQSFGANQVALGFFSSGLLLLSLFFLKPKNISLEQMSFWQALGIGLAQALAVLPGFSRSGWTIAIGLYCGLSPRTAVYFSFLISLPAILGSVIFDFIDSLYFEDSINLVNSFDSLLPLSLSFLLAFVIGFLSLLLVLKSTQKQKLFLFSFYLIPLSFWTFFFL